MTLLLAWAHGSIFASTLVWSERGGWAWQGSLPAAAKDREVMHAALDRMDRAKELEIAGNLSAARSIYREVIRDYQDTLYAAESWFQIGLIEEKEQNWERSFEAFQKVIDEYPNYGSFNRVVTAQFQVADGLMQGNKVRFLGTIPIFRSPGTAISQFDQIIQNAPFSEYAPLALFNIALLNRSRNSPTETIDALDRFINAYPRHFLLPDAYLLMAQTYASMVEGPEYDQGATHDAIGYYQDFLIQFPRNPRVAEAEQGLNEMREMLGRSKQVMADWYYVYRGNNKAASILYNEVLTVAPGTQSATQAQSQLDRIQAGEHASVGFFSRLMGSFGVRDLNDDHELNVAEDGAPTPEAREARPAETVFPEARQKRE